MNFRNKSSDEPEINLIPFIDVLLVVLIFLMLSTTYSKFTELQITLPSADASAMKTRPKELVVSVSDEGAYKLNGAPLYGNDQNALLEAMTKAAGGASDTVLVIQADASARHQSVVTAMNAARLAGLAQITFAAQTPGGRAN